ncbi:MAG: hypothetical protein MKZ67_12130 [Acidimicrobiales bacterium]|nr:hypothetical protein [Acidimicrobiales bacterium]
MPEPISPSRVRYIKLGLHGAWETDCLERGVIRIGFEAGRPERFESCLNSRWDDVFKSWIAEAAFR